MLRTQFSCSRSNCATAILLARCVIFQTAKPKVVSSTADHFWVSAALDVAALGVATKAFWLAGWLLL
jgi:hypothetical protein